MTFPIGSCLKCSALPISKQARTKAYLPISKQAHAKANSLAAYKHGTSLLCSWQ